jgi:hypothetical protein
VGGKGEGIRVGGRGVKVGEGTKRVGVVGGMGWGVGAETQEVKRNKSRRVRSARLITI